MGKLQYKQPSEAFKEDFPEPEKKTPKWKRAREISFQLLVCFAVFSVPAYILGAVFYSHYMPGLIMTWVSGFLGGFIFVSAILYVANKFETDGIDGARKHVKKLEDEHFQLLDEYNKMVRESLERQLKGLHEFLKDFYEGSPITEYLVQFKDQDLIVRVGDGDRMVDVDTSMPIDDLAERLERARLEWMGEHGD
jgi:hypothetical protein